MPAKAKTKVKGKGLTKKVGPFPLYVYLIGVGIVILYLYYRHRNSQSSSSVPGSQNQSVIPSGIVVPQQGSSGSSDSGTTPSGISSSPIDFPTDYATQTDLANAVSSIQDNTKQSIAAITFPQPNINITVPRTSVSSTTTKSKVAAKKAVTPTKKITYYTRKTQVHLKAGQKLHFANGKGYYAA